MTKFVIAFLICVLSVPAMAGLTVEIIDGKLVIPGGPGEVIQLNAADYFSIMTDMLELPDGVTLPLIIPPDPAEIIGLTPFNVNVVLLQSVPSFGVLPIVAAPVWLENPLLMENFNFINSREETVDIGIIKSASDILLLDPALYASNNDYSSDPIYVVVTPEPASLILLGIGGLLIRKTRQSL